MKQLLFIASALFLFIHLSSAQPAGKETVLFDNWATAKKNYKWDWLEKAEEGKVTRSLSGNVLSVAMENPKHTWTQAGLPYNPLPHFWYYEGGFTEEKAIEKAETGLLLKATTEGSEVKVIFVVDHKKQTYSLRRYNVTTKKWLQLNKLAGDGYNYSAAINKYDENTGAYNKLKIQRAGSNFLLYINDKLVETIILDDPSSDLNNLNGIGITGKGEQAFKVDHIKFSVFENPPGYQPKELVKADKPAPANKTAVNTNSGKTGSKFLGSIVISCGPEGYAMTSFKVYEWYGTKVPLMYGPMWEGVNNFLNIGEGKGCKMAMYFVGKTPEEAVAAEYKDLDKSIRKKVRSSITGLRIVMNDDGTTVASVTNAGSGDIAGSNNGDIQQSVADMSQFLNKGNGNSTPGRSMTTEQAANKQKEYLEFKKKLEDLDEKFKPYGELLLKPSQTVFLTIQWKQRARAIVDEEISLVDNFISKWGEYMSASELRSYTDRKDQLSKMVTRIGG